MGTVSEIVESVYAVHHAEFRSSHTGQDDLRKIRIRHNGRIITAIVTTTPLFMRLGAAVLFKQDDSGKRANSRSVVGNCDKTILGPLSDREIGRYRP
jgi:hypothetical protein